MNFNKLVYAHYVERCPKPEPFFDPLAVEQPTSTRKRAPKVRHFRYLFTIMDITLYFLEFDHILFHSPFVSQ
jgi:hypothetical protein